VRARAFGMRVVAWSRSLTHEEADRLGVAYAQTPLEVARLADAVTVNVAGNAETRQFVNADFLAAMRPGAYLINTSRGTVVDEAALERAVREKGIRAGLDVFENEPAGNTGSFGNAIVKDAHQLLKHDRRLNYIGNIEGRDILAGHAKHGSVDVVVTDGFVGNIVLKFYESVARMILGLVKREAPEVLGRDDMRKVFKILDYAEYGGAPLLGVQGVCIICHGSSTVSAIKNAIRVAVQSVQAGLSQHIGAEFAQREAASPA